MIGVQINVENEVHLVFMLIPFRSFLLLSYFCGEMQVMLVEKYL